MSGFRNPIVAGLDLIRAAIRSPNYVPGVSGWSINKDGTAEFQDLTARGDIDADSITVPTGSTTGTARLVVQSNIPPELATAGIEAALLFYAIDEVSGLERGYFFIAVSNDSSGFVDQPTLQLGEVQYPIPGDPGSATPANVKPNQFNVMMDNLIPLLRIFNLHIDQIGGLFIEDGGRFGSIDGTFGSSDVDVFEITQDGTGGIARLSPDALLDIPALSRGINLADILTVLNGGQINVDSGAEILVDLGGEIDVNGTLLLRSDLATASNAGVNAAAVTSGQNDTTSATYVNLAGTGSQTSFNFVKRFGPSDLKITMWVTGFAITSTSGVEIGVLVDGVDYKVTHGTYVLNERQGVFGIVRISGLAANTYTIQGRWLRQSGTGTLRRDANDWLTIECEEVAP